LRSGALKGVKISQMWLIEINALEAYLKRVEYLTHVGARADLPHRRNTSGWVSG